MIYEELIEEKFTNKNIDHVNDSQPDKKLIEIRAHFRLSTNRMLDVKKIKNYVKSCFNIIGWKTMEEYESRKG